MSEWQPIDTAPKDGTELLLFFPDQKYPIKLGHYYKSEHLDHGKVTYKSEGWYSGMFTSGKRDPLPSHWMTLPDPPCP